MIQGLIIKNLKQFADDRGKVMHMLRATDDVFDKFGEIYFSVINPGIVKGWIYHKKQTSNYAVVFGKIKLVLFDNRQESETKGNIETVELGPEKNYVLVKIPPGVVHGFKCLSKDPAILANCATHPHDPEDNFKIDLNSEEIPYKW